MYKYDKPLAGQEPYNAVDAISMRHDICYRDNETKEGKHACDDEKLQELDVLEPKCIQETVDRKLVRTVIGAKRKLGWGIQWSNELTDELHKPIGRNSKREECLLPVQMQYGLLIFEKQ